MCCTLHLPCTYQQKYNTVSTSLLYAPTQFQEVEEDILDTSEDNCESDDDKQSFEDDVQVCLIDCLSPLVMLCTYISIYVHMYL